MSHKEGGRKLMLCYRAEHPFLTGFGDRRRKTNGGRDKYLHGRGEDGTKRGGRQLTTDRHLSLPTTKFRCLSRYLLTDSGNETDSGILWSEGTNGGRWSAVVLPSWSPSSPLQCRYLSLPPFVFRLLSPNPDSVFTLRKT